MCVPRHATSCLLQCAQYFCPVFSWANKSHKTGAQKINSRHLQADRKRQGLFGSACLPAALLTEQFVLAQSSDGMDIVLGEVDAKVSVVVVDPEGNTAVVVLEVPLRVVLVVVMGKVHLAAIKGHKLTVVLALELDEIATKVFNDEGAVFAMVVSLSTQTTVLSD